MHGFLYAAFVCWLATCWAVPSVATTPQTTIDLDRLLVCIEMKEGAPWGNTGGALQFTRATWSDFSTEPYTWASRPDKARQIARKVLLNTIQRMERGSIKPSVYLLALRWNCGYSGMLRLRHKTWSYAEDVTNLYNNYDILRTRI